MPEEAFVSTSDYAQERRLHVTRDCDRLRDDGRPVDPDAYPEHQWCEVCSGQYEPHTQGGAGPFRLLAREDVTSIEDARAVAGGGDGD